MKPKYNRKENKDVYRMALRDGDGTNIFALKDNVEVTVIRSNRKTVTIQANVDMTVIVRAPRRAAKKDIERIEI